MNDTASAARIWRFAFGAAAILIVYFVAEGWLLDIQSAGVRLVAPSRPTIASVVPTWLAWAALAPVVVRFFRRFPLDGPRRGRTLAVYGAGALLFAIAHGLLSVPAFLWALGIPAVNRVGPFSEVLRVLWWTALRAPSAVMHFAIFAALYHAVHAWQAARERERTELRLREALTRAELDVLKLRLEPHFLFNTLNAITSFIRTSPQLAEQMIGQLSRLLRAVLELRDAHEISLAEELSLVEAYLGLQQLRFGDRLQARVTSDTSVADALVPSLLLQPLVENAVHHGLTRRRGVGHIEVSAVARDAMLHLHVAEWGENGAGLHEEPGAAVAAATNAASSDGEGSAGAGVGLSTTRSRLAQLYGAGAELRLTRSPGRSEVLVTVPLHTRPLHP